MPLDPEAKAVLETMSGAGEVDPFTVPHTVLREAFGGMPGGDSPSPEMARIEDRVIDGPGGPLTVRIYTPPGAAGPKPGIVYFHGGGWVLCSLDTHNSTCRELAGGTDAIVVSVDYRLAPEAKFPAAPEDCYAATEWVFAQAEALGIDPSRIVVAGDSAGGNLAAAVSLMAREKKGPEILHQLLVYPVTDARLETASYTENGSGYFLSKDMMRWFWHHYLETESDGENPLASPLRAEDLSGLPPATVITAEFDPLRDEGAAFAKRLQQAEVATQYTNYPGVFHGFFAMTGQIPRARQAVDDACAALRSAFGE